MSDNSISTVEERSRGTGSGNINDTKPNIVKTQIRSLLARLKNYDIPIASEYPELYIASKSLFEMMVKDIPSQMALGRFDEGQFLERTFFMLDNVQKIQLGKKTQHDASVAVGQELADEYLKDFK